MSIGLGGVFFFVEHGGLVFTSIYQSIQRELEKSMNILVLYSIRGGVG
jgi:hypothetical protein